MLLFGRGDKVTPRRSVISTPCALQASLQIFGRDMRTCVVAEQQPSRTWVPNFKSKKRGGASLFAFWSRWQDSNLRPLRPERSALPNWATPRWCLFDCFYGSASEIGNFRRTNTAKTARVLKALAQYSTKRRVCQSFFLFSLKNNWGVHCKMK